MTFARSATLLVLMILAFGGRGLAQSTDNNPEEVIRVETSLVVLNATVTDRNGRPLGGLRRPQFSVLEDGVPQAVEIFQTESTPFAAVLLVDSSGSMEERINLARSAAITFLDGLRTDDVAAIYSFDSKVRLVQDFSQSRDVAERIFDLEPEGMTVLNDAVVKAASMLAMRSERRRAIIVLSDGADTMSSASADGALKAALAANATIYTVDMSGPNLGARERMLSQGALRNFAAKSGGVFVAAPGGSALREAFKNIVSELGVQYTLGYQPTNSRKDGKWRAIEVKVSGADSVVRTRKGYNAPK